MNSESLVCPCCTTYIYDLYRCKNGHNICGDCFMRVQICPICRNDEIKDSNYILKESTSTIDKKHCKNHNKGCNAALYSCDDDHDTNCMYNSFKCRFCNSEFDNDDPETLMTYIIKHYSDNCVNEYQILHYAVPNNEETVGHQFKIARIDIKPTLIVIDKHYFVMMMPKRSETNVNFMIFPDINFMSFSVLPKYRYSNYSITISDSLSGNSAKQKIVYKQFENNILRMMSSDISKLYVVIQNNFLLKPKSKSYEKDGVHYFESYHIDGEPGSPGHWTKSDYNDILK